MLLSLCIPNFNGEQNIARAIQSCKNINLAASDFEILVIDNCSNDDSVNIVRSLKNEFPNLRLVINEQNIGRVENWNRCFELAKGKYVTFLSTNDEVHPYTNVMKYLNTLEQYPEVSLLMTDVYYNHTDHQWIYPNYKMEAIIDVKSYIQKTFFENLEFFSLGILEQCFFKVDIIRKNHLRLSDEIPRTTDRVFIHQVIKHGNGSFIYISELFCKWNLDGSRFHYNAHNKAPDFDLFWGNEFKANMKILLAEGYNEKEIFEIFLAHRYYYEFRKNSGDQVPETRQLERYEYFLKNEIEKRGINISYENVIHRLIQKL
ncbi:glycosyltransferase family 2 protein [Neobacillus muris]|uniref:glycosyltransferase family 2 protein n=1 Tax=Neobacillus muris TaxID=2941334 RepID=UPI00203DFAF8|nr:glycosyltransferase family 2 protein [Neobacillus muris]